jgi:hypothetical protein
VEKENFHGVFVQDHGTNSNVIEVLQLRLYSYLDLCPDPDRTKLLFKEV